MALRTQTARILYRNAGSQRADWCGKGIHVRVLPRVRLISPAPDNGIERYYKMVS
jgi:hypothetical protein